MRIRARHYATNEHLDLTCDERVIQSVAPTAPCAADLEADWMAPAFFDIQINGCHGKAFSSPGLTIEDVHCVVDVCRRHGIVELLPTVVTNSHAVLVHGVATLRQARERDKALARALP